MKIKNSISLGCAYLHHLLTAGNEHSVHSPFVFNLLTKSVYLKSDDPLFSRIENIRKKLLNDHSEIYVTDLGAGSAYNGKQQKRSISDITRKFAKSKKYGQLLFRLSSWFKPPVIIELGTSLGISSMYLAGGSPGSEFFTLEGCPETSAKAKSNFTQNGFDHIQCINGNFNDTLPVLLRQKGKADLVFIDGNHTYDATSEYFRLAKKYAHDGTILVFDDINWSGGMKKAWREIIADPAVTVSIDFFFVGIVFFDRGLSKQDFKLRI